MANSLTTEELNYILSQNPSYRGIGVFVETGTLCGATIFEMEKCFRELHTIELSKVLFDNIRRKHRANKIKAFLGGRARVFLKKKSTFTMATVLL